MPDSNRVLENVIRDRDPSMIRRMLEKQSPQDIASLLDRLETQDQVIVFRLLPRNTSATVFEYLNAPAQEALLKAMGQADVATLLNDMAPDDRTHLLEELPASVTNQMLALLTAEERAVAISLLGYPEDSIGRLMTPDYVKVRHDWTVERVLDHIRQYGHDSETLSTIYVVDEQDVLMDDIRIRNILLASAETRVAELMDNKFVALKAADDQEIAVSTFRREDLSRVGNTGYVVMVGVQSAILYASAWRQLMGYAVIGLIVVFGTVTAAMLIARSIARPVRLLNLAAEEFGGGNFSARAPAAERDERSRAWA